MRRQLHALRFAAGKRGCGLAQAQIAEPHFLEHAQFLHDFGHAGEEVQCLSYGEVQNFVNVLAAIAYIQNLRLVARALALLADQFDVGKKLHFHGDGAVALAGFTASTGDIEGKVPGGEASLFGLG